MPEENSSSTSCKLFYFVFVFWPVIALQKLTENVFSNRINFQSQVVYSSLFKEVTQDGKWFAVGFSSFLAIGRKTKLETLLNPFFVVENCRFPRKPSSDFRSWLDRGETWRAQNAEMKTADAQRGKNAARRGRTTIQFGKIHWTITVFRESAVCSKSFRKSLCGGVTSYFPAKWALKLQTLFHSAPFSHRKFSVKPNEQKLVRSNIFYKQFDHSSL